MAWRCWWDQRYMETPLNPIVVRPDNGSAGRLLREAKWHGINGRFWDGCGKCRREPGPVIPLPDNRIRMRVVKRAEKRAMAVWYFNTDKADASSNVPRTDGQLRWERT